MKVWARKYDEGTGSLQDGITVLEAESGETIVVEMEDGSRWQLSPMANGRLLVASPGREISVETASSVVLEGVRRP